MMRRLACRAGELTGGLIGLFWAVAGSADSVGWDVKRVIDRRTQQRSQREASRLGR